MEVEDEALLLDFECPVCKDYFYPPIRQCITGHSMCGNCCAKVSGCPVCKDDVENTRNFILESVVKRFKVPCKNRVSGCKVIDIITKIRDHQEFCEHGEILCPLNQSAQCAWVGKQYDLVRHARDHHNSQMECKEGRYLRNFFLPAVFSDRCTTIFKVIDAFNKTFKYGINVDFTLNVIQTCVQLVAPQGDASNFTFRISFTDEWTSIITSPCQRLENYDDDFFCLTGVSLDLTPLKETFHSYEGLNVQVEILLTEDLYIASLKRKSREELTHAVKRAKLPKDVNKRNSKKQSR